MFFRGSMPQFIVYVAKTAEGAGYVGFDWGVASVYCFEATIAPFGSDEIRIKVLWRGNLVAPSVRP